MNQINIKLDNKNEKNNDYYLQTNNKDDINNNKLNDEELNELNYELAIELDKRTYFQYYISLLKKKTFNIICILSFK